MAAPRAIADWLDICLRFHRCLLQHFPKMKEYESQGDCVLWGGKTAIRLAYECILALIMYDYLRPTPFY